MQKIIILDFTTTEVHIFNYDPNQYQECEDFMYYLEETKEISKVSNCQYMAIDTLEIKVH